MTDAVYWIWLQKALGAGADVLEILLEEYGDAKAIYDCEAFPFTVALTKVQRRKLADKDLQAATEELRSVEHADAWVMTPEDALYQALFDGMYAPPAVIYGKGERMTLSDVPVIAVVGTRECNDDGIAVTRKLSAGLAAGGAVIVSGGAEGLDEEAMEAALDENGKCICFQACGIDVEYPKSVSPLRKRLLENGGMILTEFPCGSPALRHHFRIRNRLISAVACGTLVTQAPARSGALITASWAIEQGRDVFAVPHSVGDFRSEGGNALLKDGAVLVTDAVDVLSHYIERYPLTVNIGAIPAAQRRAEESLRHRRHPKTVKTLPPTERGENETAVVVSVAQPPQEKAFVPCPDGVTPDAETVYAALKEGAKTVSELARELSLPTAIVMSSVTVLELYGAVSCSAGQRYALRETET